jgi:mannose-1-phosphate guanylyltransferase
MEKTDRLLLLPASFTWAEIGSWDSLADVLRHDDAGNVVDSVSVLIDARNNFLSAPNKLIAAIGVSDMVIIDMDDVILICSKSRAQDVRKVVEMLKLQGLTAYL